MIQWFQGGDELCEALTAEREGDVKGEEKWIEFIFKGFSLYICSSGDVGAPFCSSGCYSTQSRLVGWLMVTQHGHNLLEGPECARNTITSRCLSPTNRLRPLNWASRLVSVAFRNISVIVLNLRNTLHWGFCVPAPASTPVCSLWDVSGQQVCTTHPTIILFCILEGGLKSKEK